MDEIVRHHVASRPVEDNANSDVEVRVAFARLRRWKANHVQFALRRRYVAPEGSSRAALCRGSRRQNKPKTAPSSVKKPITATPAWMNTIGFFAISPRKWMDAR